MKVGIVADLIDQAPSGMQNFLFRLLSSIHTVDKGNEYVLIHSRNWDNEIYDSFANIIVPFLRPWPVEIVRNQLLVPRQANRLGVDLLHTTCQENVLAYRYPFKTIVTIYDLIPLLQTDFYWGRKPLKKWVLFSQLLPRAIELAQKVITISQHSKQDIMRVFGVEDEKIVVVYCGCDTSFRPISVDECAPEAKVFFDSRIRGHFILYVGSFDRRKNVASLVNAYARLRGSRIDHELVLAGGKGYEYKSIAKQVEELSLGDRVVFLGFVPRQHLPYLYNMADLFVFPSLYEGFGLPVLEAMACGVPVIASNRTSLPEVVGDAGILVNPENPEELVSAMSKVLGDSELGATLSRKGIERARLFSWEEAARKVIEVYQGAVGNSGGPRSL